MAWKINPDTGEIQYYEPSTGGGGGGSTNLTFVQGVNNGVVVSDTGTDATIPLADGTNAGLFSATEKSKLAGIQAGAEENVNADWNATSGDAQILNKPTSLPTSNVKHAVKYAEALNIGQAVYVSSSDGTNMLVSKADNSSENTSSKTLGLVTATGAANYQGEVITEGLLAGLDTSTATIGDAVWLGTNGNLIFWHYGGSTTKPVAPAHLVFIGIVTRVNNNNGEIFVKVQNGYEIDELHDVLISTPADKDVLLYDISTGLWKNSKLQTPVKIDNLVSANTLTIDASNGLTQLADLNNATNTTTLTISNPIEGNTYTLVVIQGSGAYGLTFPTGWWINDSAFDFTTLANDERALVTLTYLNSTWYFAAKKLTFA